MRQVPSLCRICSAMCGVLLSLDESGKIAGIRGDQDHPVGKGYACAKGLQAGALSDHPERILKPLKRLPDGSFIEIGLEAALDEIAEQLAGIIAENGPSAVGLFKGTQMYQNATASQMSVDFMKAIGSTSYYSTVTIDQSSHMVTAGRMGTWNAGKHRFEDSDVALLVGTNPLVSVAGYGLLDFNPVRRLKAAKQAGLKLIVIDPRHTETAKQADCFVQLVPGEDPTVLAGIIRIILANEWEDVAFCRRFVNGLDELRRAVDPYTPEYVAARARVPESTLETAARLFAHDSRRGIAIIGTGGAMAPRSNLSDHLTETLNVICGRLLRAGERVLNPGVLSPPREFVAEVIPPDRQWERGPKSSTGHGMLFGEKMSGILADEMLLAGPGRLRALLVDGANPAVALPDQRKAVAGLRNLDLLVSIEPYMTATAMLSHYIIPPKMLYERVDIAKPADWEGFLAGPAFNQYVPAVVEPPHGSELIDDWYLFWALAKRLNAELSFAGQSLDMTGQAPTTDNLLDILFRDSRIPLDTLRSLPRGRIFDEEAVLVKEGDVASGNRFEIAPPDIVADLAEVRTEPSRTSAEYPFLMTVRRIRSTHNSLGRDLAETRKRGTFNPAYVHPDDLRSLDLVEGDLVELCTEVAEIPAIVSSDTSMQRGVVSMTHCWGMLPGSDYLATGISTSQLVRTDANVEAINAMPAMSAIPVAIRKRPCSPSFGVESTEVQPPHDVSA